MIGVLLLTASSARAALGFERPGPIGPDRTEIASTAFPDDFAPNAQEIAATRALRHGLESSVAPRIGESRQLAEARVPTDSVATPSHQLASVDRAERRVRRSGCGEIARWCLGHATSTQAP